MIEDAERPRSECRLLADSLGYAVQALFIDVIGGES